MLVTARRRDWFTLLLFGLLLWDPPNPSVCVRREKVTGNILYILIPLCSACVRDGTLLFEDARVDVSQASTRWATAQRARLC